MKFTFNRGSWEDGFPLSNWQNEEEIEDYLTRIGYNSSKTIFGHEDTNQFEIYESENGESFYCVASPLGHYCYDVFLPDFPSLMMFVRDYGSAFSAESSNHVNQQILSTLEKLFRHEYNHPGYDICSICDPHGWEQRMKALKERRNTE